MKRTPALSKLLTLAKFARKRVEILSNVESGPTNLAGYCGIASRYLEYLANKEDIFPKFICGSFCSYNRILGTYYNMSGHVWLEIEDYIVDITSTQFRNVITKIDRDFSKKIYVCKQSNPHYVKCSEGDEAKKFVRLWYEEPLDEICRKIDLVNS